LAFTTIQGSGGAPDSFLGTAGVDVIALQNQAGAAFLSARASDDVVTFQSFTQVLSAATLYGGQGNDSLTDISFLGTNIANSFVYQNEGNDSVTLSGVTNTLIQGNAGADSITINGLASNSLVNGNQDNDSIFLLSGASASSAFGGQGNDSISLTGALNASLVQANDGSDVINIGTGPATSIANTIINGNAGDDTITFAALTAFSASTVFGGVGDDTINATIAGVGVNINGNAGADNITGSAFADTLGGGADNDTITGGLLADTMTGGAGVNTFNIVANATVSGTATALTTTGVVDAITDFKVGITTGTTTSGDVISGGAFIAAGVIGGVGNAGYATYALAAAAAEAAGGNFIAAVGSGTAFTSYLFNGGAAGGTDLSAAVQLGGSGAYGTVALAQSTIIVGQIVA